MSLASSPDPAHLLHAAPIEHYALLANGETAALVSLAGSIDWLCLPAFASQACFAALLGTADHGFWRIAPTAPPLRTTRRYRPGTLILETTFETPTGTATLIDFMPPLHGRPRGHGPSTLHRIVRCLRGSVSLESTLALRFDYGRTTPWVTRPENVLRAVAGSEIILFQAEGPSGEPLPMHGKDSTTHTPFPLHEGQQATFTLAFASIFDPPPTLTAAPPELTRTQTFWESWIASSNYTGPYKDHVERSLLTLKALTYAPSGGIVAAPTASLPESLGGPRNWDYRFCWLRDTSFTLLVLLHAGFHQEALAWRFWLLRAIAGSPAQLQTIYGICGERQLVEWQAPWLPGYEHSQPVNFGNGAVDQFQLDVFGEVAAALARMPDAQDDARIPAGALQVSLTNHLCEVWQQPDDGIWETRGGRKHFTHSKVGAWVALDRAIKQAEAVPATIHGADLPRWRAVRDQIHAEVCEKGFNPRLNSFTQSFGSDELDAACLRIPLVGFLPFDDPRIVGTVEAIEKHLTRDGLVLRYNTETAADGLPPGEGVFLACSFWLVICLHLLGRTDDAKALFERLLALTNDVGLLSEEWDPQRKRMVGNFPQALSHIALCHAAFTLSGSWKPAP